MGRTVSSQERLSERVFFREIKKNSLFSFQRQPASAPTSDNMNFEPSWAFDKMEMSDPFEFPIDPFGTLEVEGGFKGQNLFGNCQESFINEMVNQTEKEELERIKAKYQNNLELSKD